MNQSTTNQVTINQPTKEEQTMKRLTKSNHHRQQVINKLKDKHFTEELINTAYDIYIGYTKTDTHTHTIYTTIETYSDTSTTYINNHTDALYYLTWILSEPSTEEEEETPTIQQIKTPTQTQTQTQTPIKEIKETPIKPLKDHGIPVIIHDSINRQQALAKLQTKYPTQNFIDTRPRLNQIYNNKKQQYLNNLQAVYDFTPETIYPSTKRSIKNQSIKATAWYYLFNFRRCIYITDYQATIHKSDNGLPTINKPTLDRLTYSLVNSVINGPEDPTQNLCQRLTLMDYHTMEKTLITRHSNIDDVLTDLTTKIIQDPIQRDLILDEETLQATELYELAKLYDIDPQYKTLISYSTYHSEAGNTYTNMHPRSYPTDQTLQELKEIIDLYKEYGIINDKTTKKLRQDKERLSRMLQNLNTDLRHKAVRSLDYEEKLSQEYAKHATYSKTISIN